MSRVLAALAARRSAVITAALAAAAVLAPTLYAGDGPTGGVGIGLALAALAAGVGSYATAYAAIGRWEKATAGAVVVGLSALAAALAEGLPWQGALVAVALAVGAELGLVPALPSTQGSAARTVDGEVLDARVERVDVQRRLAGHGTG